MRKRFIGPASPGHDRDGQWQDDLGHEVNVAGVYVGNVKAGEVLEIPDELCKPVMRADKPDEVDVPAPVWSSELWEDVKDSPKKAKGED